MEEDNDALQNEKVELQKQLDTSTEMITSLRNDLTSAISGINWNNGKANLKLLTRTGKYSMQRLKTKAL